MRQKSVPERHPIARSGARRLSHHTAARNASAATNSAPTIASVPTPFISAPATNGSPNSPRSTMRPSANSPIPARPRENVHRTRPWIACRPRPPPRRARTAQPRRRDRPWQERQQQHGDHTAGDMHPFAAEPVDEPADRKLQGRIAEQQRRHQHAGNRDRHRQDSGMGDRTLKAERTTVKP
jgi:hypothetical protein